MWHKENAEDEKNDVCFVEMVHHMDEGLSLNNKVLQFLLNISLNIEPVLEGQDRKPQR